MSSREIIKTENVLVRVMSLETAAATEWHFHTEVRDFFVCLQGMIQVESRAPEEQTLLLPGQRAEVPPGRVHRVRNVAVDRAEYLLIQGVGVYDFCKEGLPGDR
jgi:mannose-6-phosphate isomerase-like protein (cupin superfamily)